MTPISRGFGERRRDDVDPSGIPPGQYYERGFPVLSAGPTPITPLEECPMLGTRGARLGIVAPEIYDVQVDAIMAAARAVQERRGKPPRVEITSPLVAYEQEVKILRERVEPVIADSGAEDLRPLIGTMIELPRACFVADRIARVADFFSFGTNDLTQTALYFSRDDVESGFLSEYLAQRIVDRSPAAAQAALRGPAEA